MGMFDDMTSLSDVASQPSSEAPVAGTSGVKGVTGTLAGMGQDSYDSGENPQQNEININPQAEANAQTGQNSIMGAVNPGVSQPQEGIKPPQDSTMDEIYSNSHVALDKLENTAKNTGALSPDKLATLSATKSLFADRDSKIDSIIDSIKNPDPSKDIDVYGKQQELLQANKSLRDQLYKQQQDSTDAIKNFKADPNRYWHNQGLLGSALSAIGIAMGTYGSAITHTPNAALAIVNKAMDMDWEAQKADYTKLIDLHKNSAQGIEQLNNQETHDLAALSGSELGKYQIQGAKLSSVKGQLELMAEKSTSPEFKANMQRLMLGLQGQQMDLAQKQADIRLKDAQTEAVTRKSAYGVPLDDKAVDSLQSHRDLIEGINNVKKLAKPDFFNTGNVIPGVKQANNYLATGDNAKMRAELASLVAKATKESAGGRMATPVLQLARESMGAIGDRNIDKFKDKMNALQGAIEKSYNEKLQYHRNTGKNTLGFESMVGGFPSTDPRIKQALSHGISEDQIRDYLHAKQQ